MRILIATGIYPPDVGGPAYYAQALYNVLSSEHTVVVRSYKLEKKLPIGVRHLWYFFRVACAMPRVDAVLALDTFSSGVPAVAAAKLFGKKSIVRVGGDFLWESYIERTKESIVLAQFYEQTRAYSFKEICIYRMTGWLFRASGAVVMSTKWQSEIMCEAYDIPRGKVHVIENVYSERRDGKKASRKNFLWAGRRITLKNTDRLEEAFARAKKEDASLELALSDAIAHEELLKKIAECYAVIIPSLSEVSPNIILEAIMYNKPFIVTRSCGLYDRLQDIGLFVNPLEVADIKEKILYLADAARYAAQREKIRNFAFVHTYKDIAQELVHLIERL